MIGKRGNDAPEDSEDLQALFDEIAAGRAEVPDVPAEPETGADEGDSEALQALFDSVSSSAAVPSVAVSAASDSSEGNPQHVMQRVGIMTRQVHEALSTVLGDASLRDAVAEIPDARQRLNYIVSMTEQAASRVLNATDIAQPLQSEIESSANKLHGEWSQAFANQLSVEEFRRLAEETHRFLGQASANSRLTNEQLLEIIMAQDFQDLTGQVIKRVVKIAQTLETELLSLLLEVTPADMLPVRDGTLLNGPVVDAIGRDDVVTSQEQVDDLLDSLGF